MKNPLVLQEAKKQRMRFITGVKTEDSYYYKKIIPTLANI